MNITLNLFGAYPSARSMVGAGNVVANGGVVNVEGPGTPGTGVINTFWNSVAVGGTINVRNAFTNVVNTGMTGTYNVNAGATVLWGGSVVYGGTIRLNSPVGWTNAGGVAQPILTFPR